MDTDIEVIFDYMCPGSTAGINGITRDDGSVGKLIDILHDNWLDDI